MNPIAISTMEAEFLANGSQVNLSCIWFPAHTLTPAECDSFTEQVGAISRRRRQPLNYGFFKPCNQGHWQREFLKTSMWCIVSDEMGPYGFAYHVDLGMWEGRKVIHAGLVATSKPMGLEKIHAISFALSLGNLINF